MTCPSCGAGLEEIGVGEVLVDACRRCRGVWLDRGELAEYAWSVTRGAVASVPGRFEADSIERRMDCPRCGRFTLHSGRQAGLDLARCPDCLGTWLGPSAVESLNRQRPPWKKPSSGERAGAVVEGFFRILELVVSWPTF